MATDTTCPRTCGGRVANWPDDAERGAVTRFCERHQISRAVFYKIRRQAGEVGPVGATEPGSRRPHHSPNRTDEQLIEHALAVRAWLSEQAGRRPLGSCQVK